MKATRTFWTFTRFDEEADVLHDVLDNTLLYTELPDVWDTQEEAQASADLCNSQSPSATRPYHVVRVDISITDEMPARRHEQLVGGTS